MGISPGPEQEGFWGNKSGGLATTEEDWSRKLIIMEKRISEEKLKSYILKGFFFFFCAKIHVLHEKATLRLRFVQIPKPKYTYCNIK